MTILSEVRPLSSSAKDDGDFIDLGWRPVFAEHVDREGNKFTRSSMERIAERCNERIEETSDFVPVAIGHNKEGRDPEVIGFCGPFRIGELGKKNKRAAIYGRFRVYKEDHHKVRKYPRLSVELWTSEKRPTEGYFDPISLLGSETPELDLGTRYSRAPRAGQRCVKYSAAFAGGGPNTFVPALGDKNKKPYEKASALMLSADDISQIVAALTPVIEAKVAELNPSPQVDEDMPEMTNEPDGDEAIAPEMPPEGGDEAAPPADPAADASVPPEADAPLPAGDAADEPEAEAKPLPDDKKDDEDSPAVKKYARLADEYQVKYQKAVSDLRDVTEKYTLLSAEVDGAKAEARRAVRYQKLTDLAAQGYVIEPKEELAEVESIDDAAFARHTDTIVKKYQRIPVGMIPVPKGIEDTDADKKLVQYHKEARELCDAAVKAGKHINYRDAVENVRKKYEAPAA